MKKLLFILPIFLFAFALNVDAGNRGGGDNDCRGDHCGPSPQQEECNECLKLDIKNTSDVTFGGTVNSTASTGWNKANWNGGLGKIDTGNLTAQVVLDSESGDNTTRITAPWLGGVSVKNMSNANFSGLVNSTAITGGNEANGNHGMLVRGTMCRPQITIKKEGAGKITTGDLDVTVGIAQVMGSNMTTFTSAD